MRLRETFLYFLTTVATLIFSVCGCEESKQIDCQIVGHSMATTFKSEHSVVACERCGFKFACDVVERSESTQAAVICGNCAVQIDQSGVRHGADQVKLTPGMPVKRWDVVALRRGDRVLVKRVIGLPGENVSFRQGNLLINGQIVRRPPERWNEFSIPVFDSNPGNVRTHSMKLFERLVPRDKSNWSISTGHLVHQPKRGTKTELVDSEFAVLDYRHRRCYKNSDDPKLPVSIDDAYPFNQSIRRTPHPVHELDFRVKVSFVNQGTIQLERTTPQGTFSATAKLGDDKSVALRLTRGDGSDKEVVERREVPISGRSFEIRLVNYDDLIHLFIDGKEHVDSIGFGAIDNPDRFDIDVSQPVASIGVSRNDSVTIERVSIWRDWYLFQDSPKPNVQLPLDMGRHEYYVVGDNLPVSEDSRHFGIVRDIIGVVKPVDGK